MRVAWTKKMTAEAQEKGGKSFLVIKKITTEEEESI